jgi:hypothetical protein
MAKIGRFISDPGAGSCCQITLDSGEKIVVNHSKGGAKAGRITIGQVRWMGFASGETLFTCDLDSERGRALLAHLTQGAPLTSVLAAPLGAFVEGIKDRRSIADVKTRWAAVE